MAQVGSHRVGADPGALLRRSWERGRWQSRSNTAAPRCSPLLPAAGLLLARGHREGARPQGREAAARLRAAAARIAHGPG